MDVYDNAKTHSKDKDSTKPKFQRRLHSAKSEALVSRVVLYIELNCVPKLF